ncbi:MAG: DMT family transporter [Salinibacterium sp.]|nr:DMT family transporter [Salinibacterium sp.]
MTIMFILINAIAVTISTVLGGVATRRLALPFVLFIAGVSAAAISLGFALATSGASSATGLYLGFTAGLAGGAGLSLAYRAYAIGPVGVPASTIACTTAAILAIVGFLSGESLTPFRMIGLALCGIAILLVAQRPAAGHRDHPASTLVFALLAAVGFSCFVLLIDRAPQGDGLWPLVSARAGVLVVASVMLLTVLRPGKTRPAAPTVRSIASWLAVFAGILDATANLFLLLALQSADLILVAILAPVVPVLTAVVGKIFLHEVLTRPQVFGLAVGAGAVVFAAL